jgi:hypothetical protein
LRAQAKQIQGPHEQNRIAGADPNRAPLTMRAEQAAH